MRLIVCCLISSMVLSAGAEEQMGEVEQWNEGVGYYENGDATNALRVLRPLLLTKTYGARAAEVVAKLEHERGNREEGARDHAEKALLAEAEAQCRGEYTECRQVRQ